MNILENAKEKMNQTMFAAMLKSVKFNIDKAFKKDSELWQIMIDYKRGTISQFYKMKDENEKWSGGESKIDEDKDNTSFAEMFFAGVKNQIQSSQIDFVELTFDLQNECVKRTKIYYLDLQGEKKLYDSKQNKQ